MNQDQVREPSPRGGLHAYNHLRTRAAWESTRRFWNVHQSISYLILPAVGLLVAITLRYVYRGASGLMDMATAELSVLCVAASYIVSVLGSFVVNYTWTAPADLHARRQRTILEQSQTIAVLSAQLEEAKAPKRTPAEEHQFALAKEALKQVGPSGIAVLQYLHGLGGMTFGNMVPYLPPGMTQDATLDVLNKCWQQHGLVIREESRQGLNVSYTYTISPGLQKALDELLFPRPRRREGEFQ